MNKTHPRFCDDPALGHLVLHRADKAHSILAVQVLGDQTADKLPPTPMVLPRSEGFGIKLFRRSIGTEGHRGSPTGMIHSKTVRKC